MGKTILLTGGAGYIGSHTYIALLSAGYRVVLLDNFANARRSVIGRLARITGGQVALEEADILDAAALDAVFRRHEIDAVVHFAALKAVGESVERPLDYFQTNIGGLTTLMQTMLRHEVFHIVFSSSATVYGDDAVPPTPEDAPLSWSSPYAFTKITGERMLEQAAAADSRWRTGVLRYFNPVGAHASGLIGDDPNGPPANLMPVMTQVALGKRAELQIFGDDYPTPDGTGQRDYLHVMDLAEGHVRSLDALFRTGRGHVCNLGTGQALSVLEMVEAFSRVIGRPLPRRITARRPGDVAIYQADVTRAADLLGFRAERDLDEMCRSSWHWLQTVRDMDADMDADMDPDAI